MFDISICIPTYNRSKLLQQCLDHLAGFTDTRFELIVGDNASEDDTQEVLASMSERFSDFVNLRHKTNVGFARNMDSILRRASRKYIYILSDDDLLFEEALKLCIGVMDTHERVVAVSGKYLSVRKFGSVTDIDYSDAVATIIPQGGHAALMSDFRFMSICDGHPVIRREVFERYGAYFDRTGTLIPLFFNLLQHGDILSVDKPFFQHLTTTVSLSSRMAESWFIDMFNADIELAVSGWAASLPSGSLQATRQQLLQLLYLQAARMSVNREDFYLVWLFLRRLMAVEGATQDLLIKCEYHFSHDFLINRIATIVKDAELDTVHYIDTDITQSVVSSLAALLPQIGFVAFDAKPTGEEVRLVICGDRSDVPETVSSVPLIAVNDLFEQVRLTQYRGWLVNSNQRLIVQFADTEVLQVLLAPSHAFQIICTPYSEAE